MDPLPPCPYAKKGAHVLDAILPEDGEGLATLFCNQCGIVRTFSLSPVRADDLTADEIDRLLVRRA